MLGAEARSVVTTMVRTVRLSWSAADRSVRLALILGLSSVFASSVLTALAPVALSALVDSLSPRLATFSNSVSFALLAAYVGTISVSRALTEVRANIYGRAQQRLSCHISTRVFSHLIQLPIRYHHDHNPGMLSQNVVNGLSGIRLISLHIGNTLLPLLIESFIVLIVVLTVKSNVLLLLLLATSALYAFIYARGSKSMLKPARGVTSASADAAKALTEGILNYETVKSFNAEPLVRQRFQNAQEEADYFWGQLYQNRITMSLSATAVFSVSIALALGWSTYGVSTGRVSLGEFVLINAYMLRLSTPLEFLGAAIRDITEGSAYVQRLFRILDADMENAKGVTACETSNNATLEFRNVTFGYTESREVLKNISFSMPPGKTVAIVGPSGSGKSTIVKLLLRLYEPTSGDIILDGTEISKLSLTSLRNSISTVPQETILFNDTIANNITLGRSFDQHDIELAARTADISSTILSWPDGYATLVGERGLKLSGGERQRIAIARSVIKKPRLFIFDEATSSLDSHTEWSILAQLAQVANRTTTLVIAHRLATIAHADAILVLVNGEIVEQGTHAELVARDGPYSSLWWAQHRVAVQA